MTELSTELDQTGRPLPDTAMVRPRTFAQRVLGSAMKRWGARLGVAWIGVLAVFAVFAPFIANSHPYLMKTAGGEVTSPLLIHLEPADVILLGVSFTALLLACLRRWTFAARAMCFAVFTAAITAVTVWPHVPDILDQFKMTGAAAAIRPLTRGTLLHVMLVVFAAAGLIGLGALLWRRRVFNTAGGVVVLLWMAVWLGPLCAWVIDPPRPVVYSRYREMEAAGQLEWRIMAPIPYSPTDRLRDRGDTALFEPSSEHWLGTEANGADVASRMIHAARIALAIGIIATSIAMVLGILIGGLMGYYSGIVDLLGMRLVEIFEAIPTLFLLLMFVAFFGRNLYLMMVIIGFTSWSGYARFIRAEFLKLRRQDFVQAAIATGLPLRSILFKHMLPNGVTPVLVHASFGVASAILAEATLSFLGLGLIDEPSWGEMLNQAVGAAGDFKWWMAIFPGMAIFLTVFAYNLVGEALRDAIDPHLSKAAQM